MNSAVKILVFAGLLVPLTVPAETTAQAALSSSLRATPAQGVVVDAKTGHLLATVGVANYPTAPGSLLKPFFLAAALKQQEVFPQTTVFCRRDLRIAEAGRDRSLPCTHPQTNVAFSAQEALAYSCNQYFAALADRIPAAQVTTILQHYDLPPVPTTLTREQKQLLVLGIEGIAVSPAQIAAAYRKLFLELDDVSLNAVRQGLTDSARFGMAHNAAIPGIAISGKTGTTNQGGWFAGSNHEAVVAIYLPGGNGADAARLAHNFFLATEGRTKTQQSARDLSVELYAARTVTHLIVTPLTHPGAPLAIECSRGMPRKQLTLSGSFRLQVIATEPIVAAGKWFITCRQDGLRVLLTMPSENYVSAALSGEAAPDEPLASLKAMAISMRTFALENADRHRLQGFSLCDSTHCQALRLGKPRPEVERAVHETAGETLWSGGERAHIYYNQHCGGMSESASVVWPAEQATLSGRPSCRPLLPPPLRCRMAYQDPLGATRRHLSRPGLEDPFPDHRSPGHPA